MPPLLHKLNLKSLSEGQDGRPPPSWDGAIISRILLQSRFWVRTWRISKIMMSLSGIPCQNLGKPPENRDFGRFCLVMCMPITKRYLFCWKLHLNIDSYPLAPSLLNPLTSLPFPHPSCPQPLAPFSNPFPQQFGPPLPKVNRRLKIVNYITCMRHFFCGWKWHPEVDLNWYLRISNPYCRDIQIRKCEWSQGKKMTQSKLPIKYIKLFYMYAALLL